MQNKKKRPFTQEELAEAMEELDEEAFERRNRTMYTLEYFLDLAGWRLVEDDGTEWRWGDKVSWWEPIGEEYVAAIGVIQGFNFDEETAIIKVATPFTGDVMEIPVRFLTKLS